MISQERVNASMQMIWFKLINQKNLPVHCNIISLWGYICISAKQVHYFGTCKKLRSITAILWLTLQSGQIIHLLFLHQLLAFDPRTLGEGINTGLQAGHWPPESCGPQGAGTGSHLPIVPLKQRQVSYRLTLPLQVNTILLSIYMYIVHTHFKFSKP